MTSLLDPPGRSTVGRARRDSTSAWHHIDLSLVLAAVAISALGVVMVYSSTRNSLDAQTTTTYYMQRQFVFALIGFGVMALTALIDYRRLRDVGPVLFGLTLLALAVVVSPLGQNSRGSQAWFQVGSYEFQPSELSKIALILMLATVVGSRASPSERSVVGQLDRRRFLLIIALAGAPVLLIMLQPDLGTALVFGAVLVAVLVVAGAKGSHLALLGLAAVVGAVAVLQLGVLERYQQDRLTVFLNPNEEARGAGFNLNQSKIAIGSGALTGKGLFKGSQTNLDYVPEQHTDFIFTAVGEELGFLGSSFLLALFGLLLWRIWRTATLARDPTGTVLCIGVLAMLTFQIFENVGMTMGIMPITGIPLPFMSYGGSSMLACWIGVGLVLNVHMHRYA